MDWLSGAHGNSKLKQDQCQPPRNFGDPAGHLFLSAKCQISRRDPQGRLAGIVSEWNSSGMNQVKDTLRASVRIGYDGKVHKTFRGPKAERRFENEVRVLKYLETRDCPFVPRLVEDDPETLTMVTTSCGSRVQHVDDAKVTELFAELEGYGVRHGDVDARNITYRQQDGRFCVIDFEFATITEGPDAGVGLMQDDE